MLVPKAAVNEDDSASGWQHEVGIARKISPPQGKSKAEPMQQRPYAFFWPGISAWDTAHIPTSTIRR